MKKFTLLSALSLITIFAGYSQVTRYWVGGGTAYGNDGSKWSLTSGGSAIGGTITWQNNDIARFDVNSGSDIVVIINAIGTIGKLQISGNRTVTIKPDDVENRELDINTAATDAFTLAAGCTFIITGLDAATDKNLKLNMNSGTTANINGYLIVTEAGTGYGEFTKSSGGAINFNSGSTYEHNTKESGSDIPEANWNTGSTCKITGITSSLPGNYYQNFYHFVWDCGSQSREIDFNGNLTTINGNFTVANTNNWVLGLSATSGATTTIKGNYIQTGGKFALSRAASNNTMNIDGNFNLSAGYFYMSISDGSHSTVNLKGNMSLSSGAYFYSASGTTAYTNFNFTGTSNQSFTNGGVILYYKTHFTVVSPAILDLGGYVLGHYQYSTGDFTLQSGAGIKTSHTSGMTSTGNTTGCIQLMGTRNYNSGSHYTFYASGAQATGNGLPSSPTGNITIGSAANTTNLSFSNSTTIGGSLIIVKGSVATSNISYASGGVLEYGGNALQTMGNNEWPSSTVPNLKINNGSGVAMNAGKTVTSNLNLYAGTLSIGTNNTLTLHNSSITVNSGTLTGGSLSNIIFSGSGGTTLPGVISGLKDLTINRSGATITVGGAVNVTGTLTMTAGTCALGSGSITYGPSAILLYNGSATQTTRSAEFPGSNQPAQIVFQNSTQVNLHQNRSFAGTIQLNSGSFSLGNYQLNFTGNFQQTNGNIISGTSGHLVYDENASQTMIPGGANIYLLTVDRSGGVYLNGDATVHITLTLTNGDLSIGNYQLTLNGAVSKSSGTLTGGNSSSIIFGGSSAATTLPEITLKNLVINRSNGINLGGNVTIKNLLTLTAGTLNIGANTLFLDGAISANGGSLGSSNSTLQINESVGKIATDMPQAELANLYITRSDGVLMKGNVTVQENLTLTAGNFSIGNGNTLTINGIFLENGGLLVSNNESSLTIGGAGATMMLGLADLFNLTLQRPNGIKLNSSLKIWGSFSLSNCLIDLNDNILSYGTNGTLFYNGHLTQTTSSVEWPTVEGPRNLMIQNFGNVLLHDDRTIDGQLTIMVGNFGIQTNTFTLNGNLTTHIGTLTGGQNSNLTLGNILLVPTLQLPQITLNNLYIDRTFDVQLIGDVDLYGTLSLVNGNFLLSNHTLTLRKPLAGNPDNLISEPVSNIIIDGVESGMNIGPGENIRITHLTNLTINNTHEDGIYLDGNLDLLGNLTVNPGAKFSVKPAKWLSVWGNLNLSDNECFVLNSIESGTASLILYGLQTRSGTVKAERFVKGYTSNTNGWHLLASPVNDFAIASSTFDPGTQDDLFAYSEPDHLWLNYKVPGNFTEFSNGFGYLIANSEDEKKWFSGTLNNQNISFTNLSLTEERGWNLLGNPYPCALRWNDGLWMIEGIDGLAKLWVESIHNYIDLNPGQMIPPHNGFFIRVNNPTNKLTIPLNSREHSASNWYKSEEMNSLTLKAQSLENNSATITRIRFDEEATPDFDNQSDSYYLAGFPQPPTFYAITEKNHKLSTNALPLSEECVVRLAFIKGISSTYQICAEGLNTFHEGSKIILRDELLNLSVDLITQNTYSFSSNADDNQERFKLLFSNITGIEENTNSFKPVIGYSDGKIIVSQFDTNNQLSVLCEVFDLTGRQVMRKALTGNSEIVIGQRFVKGIYIVRILLMDTGQYFSAKISIF